MSMAFPIVFVAGLGFVIPLLAGYKNLYYWAHPDAARCLELERKVEPDWAQELDRSR